MAIQTEDEEALMLIRDIIEDEFGDGSDVHQLAKDGSGAYHSTTGTWICPSLLVRVAIRAYQRGESYG